MGYFVRIDETDKLKTLLLESARDVIILLRKNDYIEEIKHEKELLIHEIQTDMNNVKMVTDQLYELLTDTKLKKEIAKEAPKVAVTFDRESVSYESAKPAVKPKTDQMKQDLSKLDATLESIERKLKSLSN